MVEWGIGLAWSAQTSWENNLDELPLGDRKETSGIVEVEGKAPGQPSVRVSVSYLPQENAIVQKLTVQNWSTSFALFIPTLNGQCIDTYYVLAQNKRSNWLVSQLVVKSALILCSNLIGRPVFCFWMSSTAEWIHPLPTLWEIVGHLKEKAQPLSILRITSRK